AVVDTLNRKYGDKEILSLTLHRRLRAKHDTSTIKSTREMLDDFECVCKQLENLGENTNTKEIETDLYEKLPDWMMKDVMTQRAIAEQWSANTLRRAVETLLKIEENSEMIKRLNLANDNTRLSRRNPPNHHVANAAPARHDTRCAFCDDNHRSEECQVAATKPDRTNIAKEKRLCLRCLKPGHSYRFCRSTAKCDNCQNRHHTAICKGRSRHLPQNQAAGQFSAVNTNTQDASTYSSSSKSRPGTMYTAEVKISNAANRNISRTTVAFCDSGSTFSYINAELATSMNLPTVGSINLSLSTFGSTTPLTKKYDVKRLILHLKNGKTLEMDILSTDTVVGPMITAQIPTNWRNYTGSLEPHFAEAEPKILIGADHLDAVIPPANMFPINDTLCIIDSEVGPIVRVAETASDSVAARAITAFAVTQEDWTPNLWDLEAIGITDKPANNVEEVQRIFNETYRKDDTGRAVVSWPFHDLTGIKPDIGLCKKR
uniref:DUF1758 domain-containing protein n=1 Tax=Panagrellus redivivus TaxID=6233 RepID=A0A7E4VT11_PANRE